MNSQKLDLDVAPASRMLWAQTRAILTSYYRMPWFSIFSMALPIMFFTFFGLPNISRDGAHVLAQLAAYAMSNVLVYNIGIGQANARARKLDLLQRATPLPGWVALTAATLGGLALGVIALTGLLIVGAVAGVSLGANQWLMLGLAVVVGSLPMLGLGMAIGYGSGPNLAPALASMIYLPTAFASGLFVPLSMMPGIVQNVAPYLPLYHLGELAFNVIGSANEPAGKALAWVAVWAAVLFFVATRAYRHDQQRKFS
jgi:ABC-2 type transport system permease protein